MPYDISKYEPGYGGLINSSGIVVNQADGIDANGNTKVAVQPAANMSSLLTFQSGATATGNGTVIDVSGYSTLTLQVTISATATVQFEYSEDNTTWNNIIGQNAGTPGSTSTSASATGVYRFNLAGSTKYVRARISSYGSGTVDVIGYASTGSLYFVPVTGTYGSSDTNSTSAQLQGVGAYNLIFDGTSWVRQRGVGALGDSLSSTVAGLPSTALHGYNGTGFDRLRIAKTYKYIEFINLTNVTATTVWTPASGKKFRLMGVSISSGAAASLYLRDGAGGTQFHAYHSAGKDTHFFDFGNGYLSSAANNVLEIYNGSGATVSVWVTAWGTEE